MLEEIEAEPGPGIDNEFPVLGAVSSFVCFHSPEELRPSLMQS